MPFLRLGTRASALARWQAEWVAARLRENGVEVELVSMATTGDRRTEPIEAIGPGEQGVFTKEIQRALLDGRIDLAVHSLKDLPTDGPPGLVLAAVPERGPVADVLVRRHEKEIGSLLPPHAVVGTGSLRRRAQLLHIQHDLQMKDVRGNVETRLRKLELGQYDAIVLAEAGLRRLGVEPRMAATLPLEIMLPAVGQGALGLETRAEDQAARRVVDRLDHRPTHLAVLAERAMLLALRGGCLAPIAALGRVGPARLTLTGLVLDRDGLERLDAHDDVALSSEAATTDNGRAAAEQLGRRVADSLVAQGAKRLIEASRHTG